MDIKQRRKQIRSEYSVMGFVVASILGITGILVLYYFGLFNITSFEDFTTWILRNGVFFTFCIFFIFIFLLVWYSYFINTLVNPTKDVLYLKKEDDNYFFISKKGKKFPYVEVNNPEEGYYNVLRTKNYVYIVLNKINDNFKLEEKKSYWLNYYSPFGNFEGIFMLPMVYVFLFIGIFSLIGRDITNGFIFTLLPIFLIIYDFIYKCKQKKSKDGFVDDSKLLKSYDIFKKILVVLIFGAILCGLTFFAMHSANRFTLIVVCVFGFFILLYALLFLIRTFNAGKLFEICCFIFQLILYACVFAFLGYLIADMLFEKNWYFLVFILPVLICVCIGFYNTFIKKEK